MDKFIFKCHDYNSAWSSILVPVPPEYIDNAFDLIALVAAFVLVLAGVYQFTPYKDACLNVNYAI